MIISCSPPPSANKLWQRTKHGMTKSAEYRAWLTEAGWQIKAQHIQPIAAPLQIALYAPANGRRDLDNFCKPCLDLIVGLKLIDGDRFATVKKITMEWHTDPAMKIVIDSMPSLPPTSAALKPRRRARSRSAATT
jgi:crossover junction endodeoxyribonuclease RusA